MEQNPLIEGWSRALSTAGLDGAILFSDHYDAESFGNGEALFGLGPLIIRILRDRGQDFVDLAPSVSPSEFMQLDDVGLALGWWPLWEVLERGHPLPLSECLTTIARQAGALQEAFSADDLPHTR